MLYSNSKYSDIDSQSLGREKNKTVNHFLINAYY